MSLIPKQHFTAQCDLCGYESLPIFVSAYTSMDGERNARVAFMKGGWVVDAGRDSFEVMNHDFCPYCVRGLEGLVSLLSPKE